MWYSLGQKRQETAMDKHPRCSDQEWAGYVAAEWASYDPLIDVRQLKFFRRQTEVGRPPRWSIGVLEMCESKRRQEKLAQEVQES